MPRQSLSTKELKYVSSLTVPHRHSLVLLQCLLLEFSSEAIGEWDDFAFVSWPGINEASIFKWTGKFFHNL
jgi:hypothetical protein